MADLPYSLPEWASDLVWKDRALLDRTLRFLRALSREDTVAVLYDADGDGLSAAASVIIGITRLRGRGPDLTMAFPHTTGFVEDDLPQQMARAGVTQIITVDKAIDQKGGAFLESLSRVAPVLVIDHHKVYSDFSSDRFILAKPHLIWETEPSSFPTAMFAYTLFSCLLDLSDKSWIPSIGIVSDSAYKRWPSFVDAAGKKWGLPPTTIEDPYKGPFGMLSYMIFCIDVLSPHQMGEFLDLLVESEDPNQVLNSGFKALTGILDAEVEEWMTRLKNEVEKVPELELIIAKVRPRHAIKSLLVNKLSHEMYPNQTVLLLQDLGQERVLVSARRQDFKVPMNTLMEKAILGLPTATGGGHVPASAASIRKVDEEKFLANVKRLLAGELKRVS